MKYFFAILFVLIAANAPSQDYYRDLKFISHLINTNQFKEASFCLEKLSSYPNLNQSCVDSVNYFMGWSAYCQKNLDTSALYLLKVSEKSPFYLKSRYFAGYNYCYLGNYTRSKKIFDSIPENDSLLIQLKQFELAGMSLLQKNYSAYGNYTNSHNSVNFALVNEKDVLDDVYKRTLRFDQKSMILAGLMSTIIPGSGKIYAGKVGEGVSSFLSVGVLAALTLENYYKAGPKNFKTIAFGSAFTIFYLGNIYGSIISVKVYRDEFNKIGENKILFNLQIPLRTLFN